MLLGALYFDHSYPPEPGYGYVAASRFRTAADLFLFGPIRRTDWRPVAAKNPAKENLFQHFRSALSDDEEDPLFHDSAEDHQAAALAAMVSRREQARAEEDEWVSEAESEDLLGTQEAEVPVDTLPTDGSMDLSEAAMAEEDALAPMGDDADNILFDLDL